MRSWVAKILIASVLTSTLALGGSAVGAAVTIKAKGSTGNFRFDPSFPHLAKGEKVRWKDTTSTAHRMAFYKGKWKGKTFQLPANGTFSKKPKKSGEYFYRCSIPGHSTLSSGNCSGMCGAFHYGD